MDAPKTESVKAFTDAFLDFRFEDIGGISDQIISSGVTTREFLAFCMPCMEAIGKKFEAGEYYLPQLVAAGEMFKTAYTKFKTLFSDQDKGPIELHVQLFKEVFRQIYCWRHEFKWWRRQGAVIQIGYQAEMPFDTFSQARNVINFSMDLFKCPELIGKSADKLSGDFADMAILIARLSSVPLIQCYFVTGPPTASSHQSSLRPWPSQAYPGSSVKSSMPA